MFFNFPINYEPFFRACSQGGSFGKIITASLQEAASRKLKGWANFCVVKTRVHENAFDLLEKVQGQHITTRQKLPTQLGGTRPEPKIMCFPFWVCFCIAGKSCLLVVHKMYKKKTDDYKILILKNLMIEGDVS